MGATLALRTLALRRVSLASAASRLYGLAPSLIQPKRSDRWPSRAGPPQLCLAFEGGRFLIVEARYYEAIGADLLAGAIRAIEAAGATYDLISVAGALEIPAGMAIALDAAKAAGRPYDGAVALGCVIRGETFHFEIVAGESARALMDMSVERRSRAGQRHPHHRDDRAGRGARRP